jgi:hypothetical protein
LFRRPLSLAAGVADQVDLADPMERRLAAVAVEERVTRARRLT